MGLSLAIALALNSCLIDCGDTASSASSGKAVPETTTVVIAEETPTAEIASASTQLNEITLQFVILNQIVTLSAGEYVVTVDASLDMRCSSSLGTFQVVDRFSTISVKDTFTDFSPKVALAYLTADYTTLYGTISKGFKSDGVQLAPNPDRESYEPEELWNYEVGFKTGLLGRRLRPNGTLYYMGWSDMQASFQENLIDENGDFVLYGGTNNADSTTSKGAELFATALVSKNLLVNFNVGYLDADFDEFVAFVDGKTAFLTNKPYLTRRIGPWQPIPNTTTASQKPGAATHGLSGATAIASRQTPVRWSSLAFLGIS